MVEVFQHMINCHAANIKGRTRFQGFGIQDSDSIRLTESCDGQGVKRAFLKWPRCKEIVDGLVEDFGPLELELHPDLIATGDQARRSLELLWRRQYGIPLTLGTSSQDFLFVDSDAYFGR